MVARPCEHNYIQLSLTGASHAKSVTFCFRGCNVSAAAGKTD